MSRSGEAERWVIATGNRGKLDELRALLTPFAIEPVPQGDFGIAAVPETGQTFVENALLKARHAAAVSGLPALADDSGLCVDALGGAPGLRSARFAGESATDADNVALLLERLAGVPADGRSAHFVCVIVVLQHALDPDPQIAVGRWHGTLAMQPAGDGGFGYDPVFVDPASGLTAAALAPAAKHRLSHRGQALRMLSSRWQDSLRNGA